MGHGSRLFGIEGDSWMILGICINSYQIYAFQKEVMKSRNKDLVELFESGAGVHHAGMLRADRGLTERLFSDGLLKVELCFVL